VAKRSKERRRGKRQENRHERRLQQHTRGNEWDVIRIPEGLEVFKPEKGETYHIDVIPHTVGQYNKNADAGYEYFEFSFPIYRELGIDGKKFVAIGELLGKRDPVAEHFAKLRKTGAEWDELKIFRPAWRQLMLLFVHEQADKGLQLFEGAYGTFGELLDEEIKANEEDYIDNFDDPDGGATLLVRFKAKNIGQTNPWILASKINFEEREDGFTADGDEKLAAEILAKAEGICLDDLLKIPDYATLQKALDGEPLNDGDEDDEDEEPVGRRTRKAKAKDEEPDEDDDDAEEEKPPKEKKGKQAPPTAKDLGIIKGAEVEHDEHGTCTVIRIAKDGLTVTLMDEDDEVHKGIDVTDVEPVEGNPDGGDAPNADDTPTTKTKMKGSDNVKGAGSSARSKGSEKTGDKPKETGGKADTDWDDDWDDIFED